MILYALIHNSEFSLDHSNVIEEQTKIHFKSHTNLIERDKIMLTKTFFFFLDCSNTII